MFAVQANFWKHLPATLANLKAAVAKLRGGVKAHTPATAQVHMCPHIETQPSLPNLTTSVFSFDLVLSVLPFLVCTECAVCSLQMSVLLVGQVVDNRPFEDFPAWFWCLLHFFRQTVLVECTCHSSQWAITSSLIIA